MKKLIILIAYVALLYSCADENVNSTEVPIEVRASFQLKYPDANNVKWQKEKENGREIYEAVWKTKGKKTEAEFEANGTFIKEE